MADPIKTGWKNPLGVIQKTKGVNPGHKCYSFSNLNNILKNDYSYAVIPVSGGVDSEHKSPIIYTYNYGFKIPSDATITKISLLAIVQQSNSPKPLYDPYGKYRYSISKYEMVKLRVGTDKEGGELGNNFAEKSGSTKLPYLQWTTESNGVFSGTPDEWGLKNNDLVSVINDGGFGVAIQFVGTLKDKWNDPAVAQLKLNIEYTLPTKPETVPVVSEFTKMVVKVGGKEITFDKNNTASIGELQRNSASSIKVTFVYTHKGMSGETPYIQLKSDTIGFSTSDKGKTNGTLVKDSFAIPKLHCSKDDQEKEYSHDVYLFAGLLIGEKTVTYEYDGKKYTLKIKITESDSDYTDSIKENLRYADQKGMVNNCKFYNNRAIGNGGASYITTEYYDGKNNTYGEIVYTTEMEKYAGHKTHPLELSDFWGASVEGTTMQERSMTSDGKINLGQKHNTGFDYPLRQIWKVGFRIQISNKGTDSDGNILLFDMGTPFKMKITTGYITKMNNETVPSFIDSTNKMNWLFFEKIYDRLYVSYTAVNGVDVDKVFVGTNNWKSYLYMVAGVGSEVNILSYSTKRGEDYRNIADNKYNDGSRCNNVWWQGKCAKVVNTVEKMP